MKFALALVAVVGVASASFRSGSVSSYEHFRYGKFVTRMKAPNKKGTVASFFTYQDGLDFSPSNWNELDIEIVPSVEHNPLSMNMIYGDGPQKLESHSYAPGYQPDDDWHTYTLEWTPHYVSWSVDGHLVRNTTTEDDPAVAHMDKPQSVRMNFWTPEFETWGRGLDPKDMPWYVKYDFVEVYTYNPVENEFLLHWRDDFDSFDSGRWHKASGGFAANSSVFHRSNVYTDGGNLVLKMEPEKEEHVHHIGGHHYYTTRDHDHLAKHFPQEPLHIKQNH